MFLTQNLHRAVATRPNAICTVYRGRRRTFAEVGERVARLAGAFRSLGIGPGDRIGMLSLNSDRYIEYYMATYWAGCAVNPANIRWSASEIAYALDDCDTRVLIVDDQFLPMVAEIRRKSVALSTLIYAGEGAAPQGMLSFEAMIAHAEPIADTCRGGADLAGVFYTGGTTGSPKGVMLSHAGMVTAALCCVAEGLAPQRGVGLHAAPMFHLADVTFMNGVFAQGGTHVIIPGFTPEGVLQAIESEQIGGVLLVPTMIQMLVDHPDVAKYDLSSLKSVVYGASPISEAVVERATRALPNADFVQGYGMTELSALATVLHPEYHRAEGRASGKVRSAGRATFCVEVRIVGSDGEELPRGETGEIAVRSAGVMLGYWKKPEETRAVLRGGWMHTGDAGYIDAEGFLFVVDRIKDMIVSGGENVYSVEVENVLQQHPAVAGCAVIGVPDEKWGERVHAVVVLKPHAEVSVAALQAHCQQHIAGYKCPRGVEFVSALPISGAGKVLKTTLRAPHWEGHQRQVG